MVDTYDKAVISLAGRVSTFCRPGHYEDSDFGGPFVFWMETDHNIYEVRCYVSDANIAHLYGMCAGERVFVVGSLIKSTDTDAIVRAQSVETTTTGCTDFEDL